MQGKSKSPIPIHIPNNHGITYQWIDDEDARPLTDQERKNLMELNRRLIKMMSSSGSKMAHVSIKF